MPLTPPLAAEIRDRAGARGMSMHALAVACDLSDASLSHRLTGRTPWSLDILSRVATALDVTTGELIAAAEERPQADLSVPAAAQASA